MFAKLPKWVKTNVEESIVNELMKVNDDAAINDSDRGAKITKLFSKVDVEIVFTK